MTTLALIRTTSIQTLEQAVVGCRLYREGLRTPKEDLFARVQATLGGTILLGILINVLSVPFVDASSSSKNEGSKGFGPGVDGVVVDAIGTEDDQVAEWLMNGLRRVSVDDSKCDVRRARFEVRRQDSTDPREPEQDGADMYLMGQSLPGIESGSIQLHLEMRLVSEVLLAGTDPYIVSKMALTAPGVDLRRDLELDATAVLPELGVIRPILVGIRELEGYRTSDLSPARCEFDAALAFAERQTPTSPNLIAAIHVLASIAWVREASLLSGEPRSTAIKEARSSLSRANDQLSAAIAAGNDEARADQLVIQSNLAGVDYLDMFSSSDTLKSEVTPEVIEERIQELGKLANEDTNSGQSFVLLTTYQAKFALAAQTRADKDSTFLPTSGEVSWLDLAEDYAEIAIQYRTGYSSQTIDPYLADSHYARGLVLYQRKSYMSAAADFRRAATLVGGRPKQDYKMYEAIALFLACAEGRAEATLEEVDDYMGRGSDLALDQLRAGAARVKKTVSETGFCDA